jgi:glycosyltransferase 2 family protein
MRAAVHPAGPPGRRPAWRRWAAAAFLALVAALLARQVQRIDWDAVGDALRAYAPATLLAGALIGACSHAIYASYELIGRRLTHHTLPAARSAAIGLVSYAFNLNFGALVGGVGLRWRLYARSGIRSALAGQLIGLSMLSNWIGYLALGGVLFAWQPLELPPQAPFAAAPLRVFGFVMLGAVVLYVGACARWPGRRWEWRGHVLRTPTAGVALLQVGLSTLNWLAISALLWLLLGREVGLATVAAVFVVAALAGVLAHVPAGLGVLEAVFVMLLAHRLPEAHILAALLVYRALYYLLPLAGATPLWWWLEKRAPTPPVR